MFDRFIPTRSPPAPIVGSEGDIRVLGDRIIAATIDVLICTLLIEVPIVYALSVVFRAQYEALGPAVVTISLVALLPIYSTYSFAFEWVFARTPGKVHRGLMVIGRAGGPPTLREAAVRNLLLYVDLIGVPPLLLGTVLPLVTGGRRLGDLLAGTLVVRAGPPQMAPLAGTTPEDERA